MAEYSYGKRHLSLRMLASSPDGPMLLPTVPYDETIGLCVVRAQASAWKNGCLCSRPFGGYARRKVLRGLLVEDMVDEYVTALEAVFPHGSKDLFECLLLASCGTEDLDSALAA